MVLCTGRKAYVALIPPLYSYDIKYPPLYTEIGKASQAFQKGAVIGYKHDEIEVRSSSYPDVTHIDACSWI